MTIFENILHEEGIKVRNLKRVISRPSHPSEDFISVSATTFRALVDKGKFAFHWHIYDNYYGYLQDDIDYCHRNDIVTLFNISRSLSKLMVEKFPECKFVEVIAPVSVSAKRVEDRRRSSPENVERRIERMQLDFDLPSNRFIVDNSGSLQDLKDTIMKFVTKHVLSSVNL